MIILDNYFDDPSIYREYALARKDYEGPGPTDGWRGYRSKELSIENKLEGEILSKIYSTGEEATGRAINRSEVYFHCTPKRVMDEIDNFHDMKWHQDPCDFAGIIYLTPDPPENTGTCLLDECVPNVYNRLLAYSGKHLHGPDHMFGDSIDTTRLTITFFIWNSDGEYNNNMKNITAYTSPGCSHCTTLKKLFERAKVTYSNVTVGDDISRAAFMQQFPMADGFPYVVIDGKSIGGLVETAKLFLEKGLVERKKE